MKYDFSLDMKTDNPLSMLIKKIKPDSFVLEFGPAMGRMTKYLQEELNCKVYIVEIDPEGFKSAMRFAEGGICANIEDNTWLELFSDIRFDYVVFADVLEHLINPQHTLEEAKKMLGENGHILISVPNIAHDAVLIDLINNRFQYREVGLLDNTHLHFFTMKSMRSLFERTQFEVVTEEAYYVDVGLTEFGNSYNDIPDNLAIAMEDRKYKNVYELIYSITPKKQNSAEKSLPQCTITSGFPMEMCSVYSDTGNGYNQNESISKKIFCGKNSLAFSLSSPAKSIRLDCLERACIVRLDNISIDGKDIDIVSFTGNFQQHIGNYYLFYNNDAQLFINTPVRQNIIVDLFVERLYHTEIAKQYSTLLYSRYIQIKDIEKQYHTLITKFSNLSAEYDALSTEYDTLSTVHTTLLGKHARLISESKDLRAEYDAISGKYNTLSIEYKALFGKCDLLINENKNLRSQRDAVALEYETVLKSACWRITKPVRRTLDALKKAKHQVGNSFREFGKLVGKVDHNLKTFGLKTTFTKILIKGEECISNVRESGQIAEQVQNSEIWEIISRWIDETPHEFIDIFHVPMGWNTPLFQRFQHLSLQAGAAGGISFYGAHPLVDKDIEICKFVSPTLCVINLDNYEIRRKLFEILDTKPGLKFIRLQSIDLATTVEELQSFLARGYEVIYEYIDELTPQIVGNIPKFVFERHEYVLRDERISVIATSDKLFEQVKPYRSHNMAMISNGVDYAHWNVRRDRLECPDDLKEIVGLGKIIIGYHGALARWIDYDLLKKLAADPRFLILLIGFAHDDYLKNSGLLNCESVYFLGPRPYNELSVYAAFYDIAILPFELNDITKSVSPVKIFEYMALGKPVVTYALPECKKYRSCLCAETQEEFISNVDKALGLRFDKPYLELLKKEALENTWQSIMRKTVDLVKENHELRKETELQTPSSVPAAGPKPDAASKQSYAQDSGPYHALKMAFWKLPFVTPRAKEKFLFLVKKIFRPSLLQCPPQAAPRPKVRTGLAGSETSGAALAGNYISQVLRLPDTSRDYVPISAGPYCREDKDCKVIAYYLTQFHPDKHNEEWWGRGVTEWNNVCRAVPQFVGHYQPRLPGELGFYDLRIRDNMARQIELAKMYGIYGFSFYYYWFNGERLLERPLEAFLDDRTLDFPFSLCWANENWTKRFDGTNFDILMEQPDTVESYCNVIHDMARFLKDPRYMKVKGKKMITVYRPDKMPEPRQVLAYWRGYCREQGIGELYLIAVKVNMVDIDLLGIGYDAISEFHPGTLYTNCKNITGAIQYIRDDFGGEVFDYRDIVENQKYFKYNLPKLYRAVMPMWDNTARRNNKGMIFQGSTPALYKQWLKDVIAEGKSRTDLDDSMVFVNAWNEWGEGAYLEPDKRFGYAYLEATREAVEESRNER